MEKKLETERRELHARLAAAVADREQMARRLEVEDTHIQNLLNAKLGEARREKVEIEAACEVEQEYLVNKMQRRMDQVSTGCMLSTSAESLIFRFPGSTSALLFPLFMCVWLLPVCVCVCRLLGTDKHSSAACSP